MTSLVLSVADGGQPGMYMYRWFLLLNVSIKMTRPCCRRRQYSRCCVTVGYSFLLRDGPGHVPVYRPTEGTRGGDAWLMTCIQERQLKASDLIECHCQQITSWKSAPSCCFLSAVVRYHKRAAHNRTLHFNMPVTISPLADFEHITLA